MNNNGYPSCFLVAYNMSAMYVLIFLFLIIIIIGLNSLEVFIRKAFNNMLNLGT